MADDNKQRGFLDHFRTSSNSLFGGKAQDVDHRSELLQMESDGEEDPTPNAIPFDTKDMPQPSSSGRATTKPWQPAAQQRPSAFDRYGTFPDIRDDDDNDDHLETALTTTNKEYARAGSSRSLGSGASGEAALDPDYDIIPMYVVPLFKHQMVVIPVPKPGPGGAQGPEWMKSVVNTGQAMQKKAAETWDSLKNSDPDSIKNKVYRAGQAQLEALSPEQRMLGGIPEYARKLKVVHAPCVDHEEVLFYMGETIRKLGHVQRYKQVGTAALLPFTFVLDSVVLPGPAILTGLTGYHCYHASKAAAGSQRLKKFVDREQGTAEHAEMSVDDMDFVVDDRLDKYYRAERDDEGVLLERVITQLCEEVGSPGLEEVMQQLRRYYLRLKKKLPQYNGSTG